MSDSSTRKAANERKEKYRKNLEHIGLTPEDDNKAIGVVVDELRMTQRNFAALSNINHVCDYYVGLDVSIFYQQVSMPPMDLKCPMFDIRDILSFTDPLIATSVSTTMDALASASPIIYHYVHDIDFMNYDHIDPRDLTKTFTDARIRVAARCQDYADILHHEAGCSVEVIKDFNLVRMIRRIFEEMRNG